MNTWKTANTCVWTLTGRLAGWFLITPAVSAAVMVTDLGTGAPPGMIGPYGVARAGPDLRPEYAWVASAPAPGGVAFDRTVSLRHVGSGWGTWSHGYAGPVYFTGGSELILTLPANTLAVGFSLQPDLVGLFPFEITAGATTLSLEIEGDGGARHIGVWSDLAGEPLSFLRLWETSGTADGFALGEISLYQVIPEPGHWAGLTALALTGWGLCRRGRRTTTGRVGPGQSVHRAQGGGPPAWPFAP